VDGRVPAAAHARPGRPRGLADRRDHPGRRRPAGVAGDGRDRSGGRLRCRRPPRPGAGRALRLHRALTGRRPWRVADPGPLGWAETALKAGAIGVGIAALLAATARPIDAAEGARLAQEIVLAVLSLGLLAAIADRLVEREGIAMAFVLLNDAGHWCMTVAVARDPEVGAYLVAFSALMLAGDLVKLVWLARTGYRVRDLSPAVPFVLTGLYAAGYVALLLLEAVA
jgi:hypothetical protein